MRTQRCHAGPAADVNHLGVGLVGEKLSIWTIDGNRVARLQIEHIRRHNSRRRLPHAGRWSGDADVEHDNALLAGIVGHGIGACDRLAHLRNNPPKLVLIPFVPVLFFDIKLAEAQLVRRALDLNIAAGLEVDIFAGRNFQHQFLDKRCHVAVRADRALPFLHIENLGIDMNLHVLLDRHLATQPNLLAKLLAGHKVALGG